MTDARASEMVASLADQAALLARAEVLLGSLLFTAWVWLGWVICARLIAVANKRGEGGGAPWG